MTKINRDDDLLAALPPIHSQPFEHTEEDISRVANLATAALVSGDEPFLTAIRHPRNEQGAPLTSVWVLDILLLSGGDTLTITTSEPENQEKAAALAAALAYAYLGITGRIDLDEVPDTFIK